MSSASICAALQVFDKRCFCLCAVRRCMSLRTSERAKRADCRVCEYRAGAESAVTNATNCAHLGEHGVGSKLKLVKLRAFQRACAKRCHDAFALKANDSVQPVWRQRISS